MNNNCAFTICAKNYIGLAQILEKSFKEFNKNADFYIIVADEFERNEISLADNVLIAKDILALDDTFWNELTFKYDLSEFCTCIKPYCFKFFLNQTSYEKVVYLDPDILFYSTLDPVFNQLEKYSIILTPHILNIEEEESLNFSEREFLSTGSFNLGFLALKKDFNSIKLVNWWASRLKNDCFAERLLGTYTDQKWISLLPCFFDNNELLISRNRGLNVAPWNFSEREVIKRENKFYVKGRNDERSSEDLLIFVHYSGYNYVDLLNGKISRKSNTAQNKYNDLKLILDLYKEYLINNKGKFLDYINLSYSYNYYNDKKSIVEPSHRRLYNGFLKRNVSIGNPFSVEKNSFYDKLSAVKMISQNKVINYNKTNLPGVNKKIKMLKILLYLVFKIMGPKNYMHLVKSFRPFSMFENHIFLINNDFIDTSL